MHVLRGQKIEAVALPYELKMGLAAPQIGTGPI